MRNAVLPAMAAFIATSSFAFADSDRSATGVVKRYDPNAMTLTLDNGTTYHMAKGMREPALQTGETVQISWRTDQGAHTVDKVTVVK
jgi:hypothetical protein